MAEVPAVFAPESKQANEDTTRDSRQSGIIPTAAWKRRLVDEFKPHKEFSVGVIEALPMVGLGYRMARYTSKQRSIHRIPMMDPFQQQFEEAIMGVPLGGIGSGTICRGWRGDFVRWTIAPAAIPAVKVVDVDQFSVSIKDVDSASMAIPETQLTPQGPNYDKRTSTVLYASCKENTRGKANIHKQWNFEGVKGEKTSYHGLFPQSWTVYDGEPDPEVKLTCRQVSPAIPHNYEESSMPAAVFEWTIENNGQYEKEVSIMFSFQNGTGAKSDEQGGHKNSVYKAKLKKAKEPQGRPPRAPSGREEKKEKKKETKDEAEGGSSQLASGGKARGKSKEGSSGRSRSRSRSCSRKEADDKEKGKDAEGKSTEKEGTIVGVKLQHNWVHDIWGLDWDGKSKPTKYKDPLSFSIATLVDDESKVSYTSSFSSKNNKSLATLWSTFSADGELDNTNDETPSKEGDTIAAALSVKERVPAGGLKKIVFTLVWDNPITRFVSGNAYYRRYTRFWGKDGNVAAKLANDALAQYPWWIRKIEEWQAPILKDKSLPDSYKMALFNELYYIVDGGTIWTDGPVNPTPEQAREIAQQNYLGNWFYLEGHEYLMCSTYDVHFYASFALIMLWPLIQLSMQRDVATATAMQLDMDWNILHDGTTCKRLVEWCVPHDMGNPGEDPWNFPNSYNIQQIFRWKDLNCKFVLQVFRDYTFTKDRKFLRDMWPVVEKSIEYLWQFDKNNDGMIENEGFPDQTYDTWSALGISAYCGGLWVATLKVARAICYHIKDKQKFTKYDSMYLRAREVYNTTLWNGEYFNYDSSTSNHHDSIQADMLAGNWYSVSCGLGGIVPYDHARSAGSKIYNFNVLKFKDARRGAVNGMRPNGSVDRSCLQSKEVWTGTTYAAAAAMVQVGLKEEAFKTIEGIIDTTYNTIGYMYQTPEAWTGEGTFRANSYMRPLSIWAMQWAFNFANQQPATDLFEMETEKKMYLKMGIDLRVKAQKMYQIHTDLSLSSKKGKPNKKEFRKSSPAPAKKADTKSEIKPVFIDDTSVVLKAPGRGIPANVQLVLPVGFTKKEGSPSAQSPKETEEKPEKEKSRWRSRSKSKEREGR